MTNKQLTARKNLHSGTGHPDQLFLDRILREGRWEEWLKVKEALSAENPRPAREDGLAPVMAWGKRIKQEAMRRMGYVSPEHEKALHRAFKDQRARDDLIAANGPTGTSQTFERSLVNLPANADEGVENKWVRAHIAMTRKQRQTDAARSILITGDDVLNAAHGPCPSREAANKLQYWANHPDEVFKNLAVPMKKGDGGEVGRDDGVV